MDINAKPFVKWAGGKGQLLDRLKGMVPKEFGSYYEPFVGGGALLFGLQPQNAIINDINTALINAYRVIRDTPQEFISEVNRLDNWERSNCEEYYNGIRDYYNDKLSYNEFDVEMAALFVIINKHCFNGLYRVNAKGRFNVSYNGTTPKSIESDSILSVSKYLREHVEIMDGDFETACNGAKRGDFIFFDSPYAPLNPQSFDSYAKEGFDIESHKRLSVLFDTLTEKGCYCILTNSNARFIGELYLNKGYRIELVEVKRYINSNVSKRAGREVIICNY